MPDSLQKSYYFLFPLALEEIIHFPSFNQQNYRMLSNFEIFANKIGEKWYLNVVLICISLIVKLEILFICLKMIEILLSTLYVSFVHFSTELWFPFFLIVKCSLMNMFIYDIYCKY